MGILLNSAHGAMGRQFLNLRIELSCKCRLADPADPESLAHRCRSHRRRAPRLESGAPADHGRSECVPYRWPLAFTSSIGSGTPYHWEDENIGTNEGQPAAHPRIPTCRTVSR